VHNLLQFALQTALRAAHWNARRLRAGWSSRANADLFSGPTPAGSLGAATQSQPASSIQATSINEAEQATIAQVLKRANKLQELEDQRVR